MSNLDPSQPLASPRLACRITRWRSTVTGAPGAHLETCPACQAYFNAQHALEAELRHEATAMRRAGAGPATLEADILRAVRTAVSADVVERRERRERGGLRTFSAMAAAVAALVVVVLVQRKEAPSKIAAGAPGEDAAVVVQVVESISSQLADSAIPSAGELVATNPLQQELASVYLDARSALAFLALNFSPVSTSVQKEPNRPL